jgi:hypothetical protein
MIGEARVGRISTSSGQPSALRADDGAALSIQLSGDYSEPALRGRLFYAYCAANAMTLPAGYATAIGLILWNPPTTGVNLVLGKWSIAMIAASSTCTGFTLSAGIQLTVPTAGANTAYADSWGNTLVVVPTPTVGKALAYSKAVLANAPTPVWILAHNTAGILANGADILTGDLGGAFIVPPGYAVSINALGAAAAATSTVSSLFWEERPIGL